MLRKSLNAGEIVREPMRSSRVSLTPDIGRSTLSYRIIEGNYEHANAFQYGIYF